MIIAMIKMWTCVCAVLLFALMKIDTDDHDDDDN